MGIAAQVVVGVGIAGQVEAAEDTIAGMEDLAVGGIPEQVGLAE